MVESVDWHVPEIGLVCRRDDIERGGSVRLIPSFRKPEARQRCGILRQNAPLSIKYATNGSDGPELQRRP